MNNPLADAALQGLKIGKKAKEEELMIGQMPRYVKGKAPSGVINKAPHIDSNYIDQQIQRGWQPLTPPGAGGPQLPGFVQNTGEPRDQLMAGRPSNMPEYIYESIQRQYGNTKYGKYTIEDQKNVINWYKKMQVDAGGKNQNVASVDYGKEMPANYRNWSEQHLKNYNEKAPGWLDRMKESTHNYPKA